MKLCSSPHHQPLAQLMSQKNQEVMYTVHMVWCNNHEVVTTASHTKEGFQEDAAWVEQEMLQITHDGLPHHLHIYLMEKVKMKIMVVIFFNVLQILNSDSMII